MLSPSITRRIRSTSSCILPLWSCVRPCTLTNSPASNSSSIARRCRTRARRAARWHPAGHREVSPPRPCRAPCEAQSRTRSRWRSAAARRRAGDVAFMMASLAWPFATGRAPRRHPDAASRRGSPSRTVPTRGRRARGRPRRDAQRNGSPSTNAPSTTAIIGLTYAWSETVDTGRCRERVDVGDERADGAGDRQVHERGERCAA